MRDDVTSNTNYATLIGKEPSPYAALNTATREGEGQVLSPKQINIMNTGTLYESIDLYQNHHTEDTQRNRNDSTI